MWEGMRQKLWLCALLVGAAVLTGCSLHAEEKKIRDVEYTVVCTEDLPEELRQEIDKVKTEEFQLSYDDGAYLYLVKGYGTRDTSGFDITVSELYLTDHTLVFDTKINGPKEGEDVTQKETTPMIAVKTERIERQIVFR